MLSRYTCVFIALAALLCLASILPAQGVVSLSGTWRHGSVGNYHATGACATNGPAIVVDHGTWILSSNGIFSATTQLVDVCPGGSPQSATEADSGTYSVGTDGSVTLDLDPGNPGTDLHRLLARPDFGVAVGSLDAAADESYATIAIRLSSGQDDTSMNGSYHVARFFETNGATGLALVAETGQITFDGAGSYAENGVRRSVAPDDTPSTATFSRNGSYAVAGDGTLVLDGGDTGAVSADGGVFFAVDQAGTQVGMSVGARIDNSFNASRATGTWGVCGLSIQVGTIPPAPAFYTLCGEATLAAAGGTLGSYGGNVFSSTSDPSGATGQSVNLLGGFSTTANGTLTLGDASGVPTIEGGIGAGGTFLLGREGQGSRTGLFLGVRKGTWPSDVGVATAGTGGIAPHLSTWGGYPYLGNLGFRFRVTGGLGGSMLMLGVSLGTVPGGIINLDLSQVVFTFLQPLSGGTNVPGAGEATIFLPIPDVPALQGLTLYAQGAMADGAGLSGLSLTQGLAVTLGR